MEKVMQCILEVGSRIPFKHKLHYIALRIPYIVHFYFSGKVEVVSRDILKTTLLCWNHITPEDCCILPPLLRVDRQAIPVILLLYSVFLLFYFFFPYGRDPKAPQKSVQFIVGNFRQITGVLENIYTTFREMQTFEQMAFFFSFFLINYSLYWYANICNQL